MPAEQSKKYLTTRQLCDRYQITPRTVDRWKKAGIIDPPLKMNGRDLYDEERLEARERERMGRDERAA
jgi:predicted site-specific integrase-resolvase